jgi:hypothetical protein
VSRRRALPARILGVAVLLLIGLAPHARGESWGGITPGETTRQALRASYGPPTRERVLVEEGRTVAEWTYAGQQAPRGIERVVVSFGLVRPGGFDPEVVRAVTLYPKPRIFSTQAITNGWGKPDGVATEEATGRPALQWASRGLLIVLDKGGNWAEMMLFAPKPPAQP